MRRHEADDPRVLELTRALQTVDDQGPMLPRLMGPLRELIGAEKSLAYRVVGEEGAFGVEFVHADRLDAARVKEVFAPFVRAVPAFGLYNPARPEAAQRNRVLRMDQLLPSGQTIRIQHEIYPKFGVARADQLRVLLCAGDNLLAWVGGFRDEPFDEAEIARFEALVPHLRQRLFLEQQIDQQRLSAATLEVALEALPLPTLVIDARGQVGCANLAGKAWLAATGRGGRQLLADAARGRGSAAIALTPIALHGVPRAFLATLGSRGRPSPEPARRAARQLRLTPRQGEVLEQLALGASNKSIARALQCAVKTVELHVSAILHKAGVRSRAELLAALGAGADFHPVRE